MQRKEMDMAENYNFDHPNTYWTELEAKIKNSRSTVLIALIFTVVNIVFVMFGSDTQLVYAMTAPYYFVIFGKGMDNRFTMGTWSETGVYTRTGLLLALVILGFVALCWFLSARRSSILQWLLAVAIVDALVLVALSVYFVGGLLGSLVDIIFHVFLIVRLVQGIKAARKLEQKRLDYGADVQNEEQQDIQE